MGHKDMRNLLWPEAELLLDLLWLGSWEVEEEAEVNGDVWEVLQGQEEGRELWDTDRDDLRITLAVKESGRTTC